MSFASLTPEEIEISSCASFNDDTWFPAKGQRHTGPKRVCNGCEVRDRCLEVALINQEDFGIWGGLNERERRKLLRGMKRSG